MKPILVILTTLLIQACSDSERAEGSNDSDISPDQDSIKISQPRQQPIAFPDSMVQNRHVDYILNAQACMTCHLNSNRSNLDSLQSKYPAIRKLLQRTNRSVQEKWSDSDSCSRDKNEFPAKTKNTANSWQQVHVISIEKLGIEDQTCLKCHY